MTTRRKLTQEQEVMMGLDATWYRGLRKRDDVIFDGDGEPTNVDDYVRPTVNADFPGREGSIEHRAIYEYAASGEAFSGAYSAYMGWRDWLAQVAGHPLGHYQQYDRDWPSHCVACWDGNEGPFCELINFTDCDGVLGSEVCAKLAKDFAQFDEAAKAAPDGRGVRGATYYAVYRRWRHALEQAANNGCVTFH